MTSPHHLSDHDLLLSLDRELPSRQQAAASMHLLECVACRERRALVVHAANLASARYQAESVEPDSLRLDAARERLRTQLAGLTRAPGSSAPGFLSLRLARFAIVGVAALAVVWLVRGMERPMDRAGLRTSMDNALPAASLTPGATWNVTVAELCAPGRLEQRPVSDTVRQTVLRSYAMERVPANEYELDYLITPELGGAPAAENLWPQRYGSREWNARVKDQLEELLSTMVCNGEVPLQRAQQDIARNWITAYKMYFRTDRPLRLSARASLEDGDRMTYPVWRGQGGAPLRMVSLARTR